MGIPIAPFNFISRDLEVELTTGTNESVRNGERVKVSATVYSSHQKVKTYYKWTIIGKITRKDYTKNATVNPSYSGYGTQDSGDAATNNGALQNMNCGIKLSRIQCHQVIV